MTPRLRILAILPCGIALLLADLASANGINPPRVREGAVIKASCQEKSGERQHEILRARVLAAGKSTDLLTFRIGDASEQVAIRDIKSITLTGSAVDVRGFTPARLVRRDDTSEESVAVQVRSKDSAFRLSGFDASGSSLSIDLVKCARVEFSAGATGSTGPEHKPVMKK